MSMVSSIYSILTRPNIVFRPLYYAFQKNNYAKAPSSGVMGGALKKKKLGKLGVVLEKVVLPVETNPERLVNYACGANVYKTGEDPKLGTDSDYPDWLWKVRIGPPEPLESLDKDSLEYWRRVRKLAMKRNTQLRRSKKF